MTQSTCACLAFAWASKIRRRRIRCINGKEEKKEPREGERQNEKITTDDCIFLSLVPVWREEKKWSDKVLFMSQNTTSGSNQVG